LKVCSTYYFPNASMTVTWVDSTIYQKRQLANNC
jgi:hypothetical protein